MASSFNAAWRTLFEELDIQDELERRGVFRLSAERIKSETGKEPRLMCKWDSRADRPEILQANRVTILPISRKEYLLLRGDGYKDLPPVGPARYYSPERLERFQTLNWRTELRGEPEAVDTALLASVLREFTGEAELVLTIRGKSGSSAFEFNFQGEGRRHHVAVDGAIVEVDAGFEADRVWLLEAKARQVEDFIIRQLYYPWRLWSAKVRKTVIPVFLSYTNRVFGFYEYRFGDEKDYHSIQLVRSAWYTFDPPLRLPALDALFAETRRIRAPEDVPFPQADTLGMVIDTVELYFEGTGRAAELADLFGVDPRQGDYYSNAAAWLGLVEKRGREFAATEAGRQFARANRFERFGILFREIAARPVFREAIEARLQGRPLVEEDIATHIGRLGYKRVTSLRRSKTVIAWVEWLWQEHARLLQEAG